MPGNTHPIDIIVEVLTNDTQLQVLVRDGFHHADFSDGMLYLSGRVFLSMVRPTQIPTLYTGVVEVLLGCKYENSENDHVNKCKAAERIVEVLATKSHSVPDRSSTGQMVFLGWSNVDGARMGLPQDLLSITFEMPFRIVPS